MDLIEVLNSDNSIVVPNNDGLRGHLGLPRPFTNLLKGELRQQTTLAVWGPQCIIYYY